MAMYPHQNLNIHERAALDRLRAPWFQFVRSWLNVEVTDPDGKGLYFYPRSRRTWTFYVKGYVVLQVSGRLHEYRY